MAKKPANVFRAAPGLKATSKQQEHHTHREIKAPVPRERVQVYKDGTNRDRLSITQQVIDGPGVRGPRAHGAGNVAYEELLQCIYDAVLITDYDGNIKEANERAEHHFMWTRSELCEGNVVQLISGADARLMVVVRQNIESGKFSVLEAICVCGDESRFNAEIVVNRLGDRKIAFFIRNITERKKVEEELKQASDRLIEAEKMQTRIDTLSTLAYELNNPLQILTCLAEVDKNEEYKKQIVRILGVMDHLRNQESLESVMDEEVGTRYQVPAPAPEIKECDARRILVVDDEAMLKEMFVTSLRSAFPGVTVESASDGSQALDAFRRDHHGIIVMDVSMPVMNGEQAFSEMKGECEKSGYRMPVFIFCTGFVVSSGLQAIIDEDPSRVCLQKPMSINDLIGAVRRYVAV